MGLDDTAVADRRHLQGGGGLCRHNNQSAVGLDEPLVFHKSVDRSLIDRVGDKPVTVEVKQNLIACGKKDVAAVGGNAPFVCNLWRNKGKNVAISNIDGALIENGTCTASIGELVFASKKITVEHVE